MTSNKRERVRRHASTRSAARRRLEPAELSLDDHKRPSRVAYNWVVKGETPASRRKVQGYDLKIPTDEGRAGQLLRVKLIHFMCHDHFEIYFGRHVNFVSGKNGSGKSAILQAIQVCFGSKAFDTGRGKNINGFIKTEKSYAKASVSLWNTGTDAYRPEDYGRVITIERSFAHGSSRYSLISEKGYCLSNRKNDLDAMVMAFGILCKNPMVVLTQGAASSFLRGRKLANDLYGLYMKATEFEEAAEEHQESHKQIQNQKQHIENVRQQLKEMHNYRTDLSARLERAQEERTAVECLEHAQNVGGFLEVKEREETVAEQEAIIQEETAAVTALREDLNAKKSEVDKAGEEQRSFDAESQAAAIRGMLERLRREEHELKEQKRVAEKACRDPKKRILDLEKEIQQLERKKHEKETNLEALRNDDGEEVRAAKAEFAAEVEAREQRVQQLSSDIDRRRQEISTMDETMNDHQKKLKKLVDTCDEHTADIRRLESSLNELRRTQRDPVTMFGGEAIQRLLATIQRAKGRFEHEPIGPVGRYLSLRDERWSVSIEFATGHLFNTFIVHSFQDEETLREICRQVDSRIRLHIVVYPFNRAPYDIGTYDNPPHLTILRILQVVDFQFQHVIRNVLIDYGGAERIVLADSEEKAFKILEDKTPGFVPHSVRLPTGRKVYMSRHSKASVHDGRKLHPRLVKDITQQIKRMAQDLQLRKETSTTKLSEKRESEEIFRDLTKKRDQEESELFSIQQMHNLEDTELQQLKARGPSLPAFAAFDIESLVEEITKVEEAIQDVQRRIDEVDKELKFKEQQVTSTEERIAAHRAEFHSKKKDADALSVQMNRILSRCNSAKTAFERAQEMLTQKENRLAQLTETRDEAMEEVMELQTKAKDYCSEEQFHQSMLYLETQRTGEPDANQPLTTARLESWVVDLKRRVRNFRMHSNDDYEELQVEYAQMSRKIEQQTSAVDNLQLLCNESEVGLQRRGDLYRKNQKRMDNTINTHFNRYMKKRAHHGVLKPNHKEQIVDIQVKLANQGETVCDMASLSGGERSFTTVSLLLALASVVNSPFHCMDEFDVFTDAITKHCAIQALLETAAFEKTESQFVFFSPQEVGTVEEVLREINGKIESNSDQPQISSDFVMIYRMAAPRSE